MELVDRLSDTDLHHAVVHSLLQTVLVGAYILRTVKSVQLKVYVPHHRKLKRKKLLTSNSV